MRSEQHEIDEAVRLFRALGNASRIRLLLALMEQPQSVSDLAVTVGLTQPLTSQYLRVLADRGLVSSTRQGRAVIYQVADRHVVHVLEDALTHVSETAPDITTHDTKKEDTMATIEAHAEHTLAEHTNGPNCGHKAVQHGDHTDYLHDGHLHALHGDHYDEH